MLKRPALASSALLVAALALGCRAAPPPPKPRAAAPPPAPREERPAPEGVQAEIGGLNEEAVERAFAALDVQPCLDQGGKRLKEIGGAFKVKVRIDRDGGARWAYMSASTLGDRDTEKCLLEQVRAKSWPKPLGGEGIAEKEYAIDPRSKPVMVEEKRLKKELARARAAASACRRGVPGVFFATLYLRPSGRVAAAGVAPPSEKGEDVADCIVEAIRKTKFRPVAGRPAKISFEIR